jgi:hypothetical protein
MPDVETGEQTSAIGAMFPAPRMDGAVIRISMVLPLSLFERS